MPIIRKVIRVGSSRAVSIPSGWLKFFEKSGRKVEQVAVTEENGSLVISPIFAEGEPRDD